MTADEEAIRADSLRYCCGEHGGSSAIGCEFGLQNGGRRKDLLLSLRNGSHGGRYEAQHERASYHRQSEKQNDRESCKASKKLA